MNKDDEIFLRFHIIPNDLSLYQQALTHASFSNENSSSPSYDRLEFLGDSLLDMIVASIVYENFPSFNSGKLSKVRSILVSGENLSHLSEDVFFLDKYVRYSVGEKNNTRFHHHINEDVFEAFLGAIYLDLGYDKVTQVIREIFSPLIKEASESLENYDPKTSLQEKLGTQLKYRVKNIENFNSQDVHYVVEAVYNDAILGVGEGHNILQAEKNAAKDALSKKVGE